MIGGVVAVGLVVWVVAPAAGTAALPLLVTLVCPLSMGVMAWQMRRGGGHAAPGRAGGGSPAASAAVTAETRPTREELAMERARERLSERKDQPRT